MADHFTLPFILAGSSYAVNEQDSTADIEACVVALLRSRIGYRDDRPELGIPDPAHRQGGIDLEELVDALDTFEPRAQVVMSREDLQGLIDRITAQMQEAR